MGKNKFIPRVGAWSDDHEWGRLRLAQIYAEVPSKSLVGSASQSNFHSAIASTVKRKGSMI